MSKLIIGPGRLSYPHLFKPQQTENGERYNTAILLPPEYDTKPIVDALRSAWVEKFGKDKDKWPKGPTVRTPDKVLRKAEDIQHGETMERIYGPEFDGWTVLNVGCGAEYPPGIVDGAKNEVTKASEIYPGRWARISAAAYAYSNKTKGVTIGLNNVQLLKNDTSLGGRSQAKHDFDEVAEEMGTGAEDQWD